MIAVGMTLVIITAGIGKFFGPITLVWFASIAVLLGFASVSFGASTKIFAIGEGIDEFLEKADALVLTGDLIDYGRGFAGQISNIVATQLVTPIVTVASGSVAP